MVVLVWPSLRHLPGHALLAAWCLLTLLLFQCWSRIISKRMVLATAAAAFLNLPKPIGIALLIAGSSADIF